jgi:uncharacterized protein
MQNSYLIADDLKYQVSKSKPLLIAVVAGMALLLVGLQILPVESTPLMAKVMGLLSPTLAAAAVGAYLGRNIRGWLPMIGLMVVSFAGLFILRAMGGSGLAIPLLLGWGVVNGMMLGPLVGFAVAEGGPQIVLQALLGSTIVMMATGLIAFATGVNVSFLAPILFIGLMALIVMGLVGIFVRFSQKVNMVYSIIGMVVFAGYFLYDFARVRDSENTWEMAMNLTTKLYLDFANFFIFLLQYLLNNRRR